MKRGLFFKNLANIFAKNLDQTIKQHSSVVRSKTNKKNFAIQILIFLWQIDKKLLKILE